MSALLINPAGWVTVHAQQTFDVTSYGADPTGVKDSTLPVQSAINDAQAAGPSNIVHFPTGTYAFFKQISSGTSLTVSGTVPVVLQGDGATASVLVEEVGKNLLAVHADGTVVNQLELNTEPNSMTTSAQAALIMSANNTLLENSTIRGGPNTYALFYPGPPSATPANPLYNTGNQVNQVTVSDQWNRDGFSFAYQESGLIQNIDHTGSRLALFVDTDVEVDNEHYHPGSNPTNTQGFWITAPSHNVTINGFVTDGNGGTIGSGGQTSSGITINNEVFNNPGFHLSVGEVKGLTINGCNFGSNSTLRFISTHQATNVLVENCTALPVVRFEQPLKHPGTVQATFTNNTYTPFTAVTGEGSQTFYNVTGGPTDFTVNGGTFQNCAGGLFRGSNTTFAVNTLSGYPCSPDAAPSAALNVTPSSGAPPLMVTGDASASTDSDATPIVDYQFDWGDGSTPSARQPSATLSHTYSNVGMYTVSVDVIDSAGLNSIATMTVTVSAPNLVGNPGFETDTSGWKANGGAVLSRSTTAHSGSYSVQLTRARLGRAVLSDSPAWNTNTTAGTTCHISAWVQTDATSAYVRTVEYQGATVVAKHSSSVATVAGSWFQLNLAAPVVNGGDTLHIFVLATIGPGQLLLVDDVTESCY